MVEALFEEQEERSTTEDSQTACILGLLRVNMLNSHSENRKSVSQLVIFQGEEVIFQGEEQEHAW